MSPPALLAPAIRAALVTARRLGAPRVIRDIPAQELDVWAYATAYLLGARAWLLWQRAPSWRRIERAWAEAVGNEAVRTELSGTLDPRDTCRLVTDEGEAFVERSRLYAAARARVDIAPYYVQPDDTGWSTASDLAACSARGVRVRLVVDHHMTERKRREVPGVDALFADPRRSGVEVAEVFARRPRPRGPAVQPRLLRLPVSLSEARIVTRLAELGPARATGRGRSGLSGACQRRSFALSTVHMRCGVSTIGRAAERA